MTLDRLYSLWDMAVHLCILFMISGFTGIHSVYTVSKVSVKAGRSVSIPCFYGLEYRNHVKYLCKGSKWLSCTYEIKTNQPYPAKYSISDDKNQGVFTVTIKDLTDEDTDFWCVVEINNGGDHGKHFQLLVNKNIPSLSVSNQEILGFYGEMATINCSYNNVGESRWCRMGSICVTESSRSLGGSRITVNRSIRNVFIVTMSGLTIGDSGWYACERGDLQMPVHLTVNEKPTTNTSGSGNFSESNPGQENQSRSPVDLLSLIVSLILLLIVILVSVLIWFVLRKRRNSKAPSSDISAAEADEARSPDMDKDPGQICTRTDGDITYSDVVPMRRTNKPKVKTNDENVTYSTLS